MTPSAPKLRRVLALLTMQAGSLIRIDQFIEELWEDRPPVSATTTLQTYIYQLRKLFRWHSTGLGGHELDGAVSLRTAPGGYALRLPDGAVDAGRFETLVGDGRARIEADDLEAGSKLLREAVSLWRGPALTAVGSGPVLRAESVRLEEIRKTVIEERIDADLKLGRHHQLISELTGMVAQHPTHEGFQGKLMLALYRAGRRSEALQTYQQTRRVLTQELGVEPTAELQRLHLAMLSADPSLDATAERATATATAPASPPSQLPPDCSAMVGRGEELDAVVAALTDEGRTSAPVVMAVGAPGSGKSAFCVHAAHRLRAEYPDGQLYARLLEPDGTAVEPATVLADFLRALGVPDRDIPSSLRERIWAYRSQLANRRVLVVLDDVVCAERIMPLLPTGAGCATLVAGRRRLTHPAITLDVLLPRLGYRDSVQLLSQAVGRQRLSRDPHALGQLVAACDGVPAALGLAASQLRLRPHWPIARLLPQLHGEPAPSAPVAPSGGTALTGTALTYQLLSPVDQRDFGTLADAATEPVCAPEVAELLTIDEASAEALLERLVEFQLAEIDEDTPLAPTGGFRYRFHPQVRAAARRLTGEPALAGGGRPGWPAVESRGA